MAWTFFDKLMLVILICSIGIIIFRAFWDAYQERREVMAILADPVAWARVNEGAIPTQTPTRREAKPQADDDEDPFRDDSQDIIHGYEPDLTRPGDCFLYDHPFGFDETTGT